MLRTTIFASLLASSAITLAVAGPAAAGEKDRAREAIAAAEAKIHTAETLGAGASSPRDTADARAALASAKEDFKTHHREDAIQEAIRASALADTAIGLAQQHRDAALAAAHADQRATAEAARDQVAAARDQALAAQQQADAANARADSAQQAAAASAADAAAARTAAAVAAAQPAPAAPEVETTVTTRHGATVHHTRTHAAPRKTTSSAVVAAPADQVTATTRVTPQQ